MPVVVAVVSPGSAAGVARPVAQAPSRARRRAAVPTVAPDLAVCGLMVLGRGRAGRGSAPVAARSVVTRGDAVTRSVATNCAKTLTLCARPGHSGATGPVPGSPGG
ncbi:hypothetical protein GCM10023225_03450 [Kineococcus glutinatus]|uniref:Secreted protein n=1 Tax=Kineococcus glutinatus TaxID=1070872 RepID=A0ABP9H867_9ACTN